MGIAKLEQYGLLQVAGGDARAFLHAQLTNDIEHLAPATARYAGWCSAKGRLLATFLVVPCAEGFLLQLSRDLVPAVAKRLSMFILRSKVKISDATGRWALKHSLNGKMWIDIEAKGKPGKWITLRALRVLKAAGRV